MHRLQGRAGIAAAATVVVVLVVVALAVWKGGGSDVVVTDGTDSGEQIAPAEASTSSSGAREGDNSGSLAEACGVEDIDGDTILDGCDDDVEDGPAADPDGDGIDNIVDNCPLVPNPEQTDGDGDGIGNACDADGPEGDLDADGIANRYDNCEDASNEDQRDRDGDGTGDACDSDLDDGPDADPDGDGFTNAFDNCDTTENPDQADADADGVGDVCDGDNAPPPSNDSDSPSNTGSEDEQATGPDTGGSHPLPGQPCILFLHGAGTTTPSYTEMWPEDILYVAPHSPSPEWPHFWLYDGPHLAYTDGDGPYNDLVRFVTAELDAADCGPIMMHGTSSGGGFAAKLYCRGEDFGGRLWGVMVDDPVPDAGVVGCSPSSSVQRVLFTHSAEIAREAALFEDNRCTRSPTLPYPWYCEDDTGFDVDEYEAHIGRETILAREMHVGGNDPAYNFWSINLSWWFDYDPVTFAALEGR